MGTIVEIKGVKFEVDERTAQLKQIEHFKVGDQCKLLKKTYSDSFERKYGVIIGFETFKNLPSIVVAYLEYNEIKFAHINEKSEDEVRPVEDFDTLLERDTIINAMDLNISKSELALQELRHKRDLFVKKFGKFFDENCKQQV